MMVTTSIEWADAGGAVICDDNKSDNKTTNRTTTTEAQNDLRDGRSQTTEKKIQINMI
jgi:hypothetical protein